MWKNGVQVGTDSDWKIVKGQNITLALKNNGSAWYWDYASDLVTTPPIFSLDANSIVKRASRCLRLCAASAKLSMAIIFNLSSKGFQQLIDFELPREFVANLRQCLQFFTRIILLPRSDKNLG